MDSFVDFVFQVSFLVKNKHLSFGQNKTEVMEVRKETVGAFFKGKGFYAALAVGAAAIFAVGILNTNTISNENNELAKNPSSQVAENAGQEEAQQDISGIKESENSITNNTDLTLENQVQESSSEENSEKEPVKTDGQKQEENGKTDEDEMSDLIEPAPVESETMEEAQAEEPVAEVLSQESQINSLNFSEEDGLSWPVQGKILLEYSMSKPVYFKTLAQYKCNSAIVIEAKENTEVFSAAKGMITDISEIDETGTTITASIGNDYQLIYGQLSDVQVEVGDVVEAGALLGTIAAPTKYYVEEGSNLYFKVLAGDEPVDPLLLLN